MLSDQVDRDKLIADIEQQIEILTAIAADNPILLEQLRLLQEARGVIEEQQLELEMLAEQLDPDADNHMLSIVDRADLGTIPD